MVIWYLTQQLVISLPASFCAVGCGLPWYCALSGGEQFDCGQKNDPALIWEKNLYSAIYYVINTGKYSPLSGFLCEGNSVKMSRTNQACFCV